MSAVLVVSSTNTEMLFSVAGSQTQTSTVKKELVYIFVYIWLGLGALIILTGRAHVADLFSCF